MDKRKDKRNKAEQFRKSKKNFFKRGCKIGIKSDAEIFVLIKRKGKLYKFTNTNRPSWPSQAEIVRSTSLKIPVNWPLKDCSKATAKTAADFEPKPRQSKDTESSPAASGQDFALSALGIKAPTALRLDLCSPRRLRGQKEVHGYWINILFK